MPYRDHTGPDGRGPMTGRGMGTCSRPGNNAHFLLGGRLLRGGRCAFYGGGRRRGYAYRQQPYLEQVSLEEERSIIMQRLADIEAQIKDKK